MTVMEDDSTFPLKAARFSKNTLYLCRARGTTPRACAQLLERRAEMGSSVSFSHRTLTHTQSMKSARAKILRIAATIQNGY